MSHTLLLADDSVTIQRVIELTFADEDVNVVAVSDGDEAIAVMDRTPPDIVLADVGMPGRNGYEVAQHIRDTPRLSHIPVVLLTGAFEPIDQAKATAAGCDGVLAKPFEPQLVIGRVKELLAKPKQTSSLDVPLAPPPGTEAWAPSFADPEPPAGSAGTGEPADYFERLDQAFTNLTSARDAAARGAASPTALDWFASQPPPAFDAAPHQAADTARGAEPLPDRWDAPRSAPSGPDAPYTYGPPPPYGYGETRAPIPPPPPLPTLPPLAEAFAALLEAEQKSPTPAAAPQWPSLPQPSNAALSDDAIDRIARRVLEKISDRVLSEAVEEKVSQIAERLIREEIDRIKRSIK